MANLLVETGRYEEAVEYARTAREIFIELLPENHWRVAVSRYFEGLALAGLGQFDDAEQLLLASLEGLESAPIAGLAEKGRDALNRGCGGL